MLRQIDIFWLEKGQFDSILQKLFPFPEDMGPHLPPWPREYWNVEFPKISRVFPELCANDIVGVNPMSAPSAKIFYLEFMVHNDGKETHYQQI